MGLSIIQGGVGCGALVGAASGTLGWFQNKFELRKWVQQIDPTYVSPSFKVGLILGLPVVGVEMGARSLEIIDKNLTNLQEKNKFAFKMAMIALRTFAFIKGAEFLTSRGYPIHKGFIYQGAVLYATASIDRFIIPFSGVFGYCIGMVLGIDAWLFRICKIDVLIQKISPTYFSHSFKDAFAFGATVASVSIFGEALFKGLEGDQRVSFERKHPEVWSVMQGCVALSALFGIAEIFRKSGYQIHPVYVEKLAAYTIAITCINLRSSGGR